MSKEKILEEFDKTILEPLDKKDWGICPSQILAIKQFFSQAIDQTREETIREVEDMVNKIILKDLTGKWSNDVVDFSTSIVNATVSKIKQSLKSLINK